MQQKYIITALFLLFASLVSAGCTGTQSPPAAPAPTTALQPPVAVTTAVPPAAPDLVVSPTDSVVDANRVSINVEKDYLGSVTVTFQGGSGLQQVKRIEAVLNRADGVVKREDVGIRLDDSITLEGTKETDRIIVYVTMKDGRTYKTVDTLLPYRTR